MIEPVILARYYKVSHKRAGKEKEIIKPKLLIIYIFKPTNLFCSTHLFYLPFSVSGNI